MITKTYRLWTVLIGKSIVCDEYGPVFYRNRKSAESFSGMTKDKVVRVIVKVEVQP